MLQVDQDHVFIKTFCSSSHTQYTTHKATIPWGLTFNINCDTRLACAPLPAMALHLLLTFPPLPRCTPFSRVCILRARSTVFLSLGSVSMSLHLICIRFSTLSGSYLIPTQYAAEGNWVLRPRERGREVFGGFLNSLQYCVAVSTELAWQHEATEVCVIAIQREYGRAFANHAATAIEGLFSSPHFNITCLLVETVQASGNTTKILMSQPHTVWGAHSVDRWKRTAEDSFCDF